MLLLTCSALAALACHNVARPLGPRGPLASEQHHPPILLALTCTLDGVADTVTCEPQQAFTTSRARPDVVHGSWGTYANFFPSKLVKDTLAQTWTFTANVQNLLQQSIGTLDGTSVTGVKVFVTALTVTGGSGNSRLANPSGTGTLIAPNQPYIDYSQIIAPNEYSGNKSWRFNVPSSVTGISMSIMISTDFPAEQNVTALPPATRPAWFNSAVAHCHRATELTTSRSRMMDPAHNLAAQSTG